MQRCGGKTELGGVRGAERRPGWLEQGERRQSDREVGRREGTSEGSGCHPGALNRVRDD